MQEYFLHSLIPLYLWVRCTYFHARMFCTLTPMTSIPVGGIYLHARTFFTLADTTSIPMGAMYLHARKFCTLSDTFLCPLRATIFTVINEVWPRANWAVVTNNLTVIIEVVLIKGFLYSYQKGISLIVPVSWKIQDYTKINL